MITPDKWRKSSYSGGGDGNNCVEMADTRTHIAVRDSKAPAGAVLVFPAGAFSAFVDALKGYTGFRG
ncbi:DUF397 domain-containing protein [Streptomyces tropicalis]|uniref:DUF397 domain-containing protein n=1 Tax=Streptomyces tropicalis TaxID=3034234 RepID=A0ABT6AAG9_9ACTN|nr:DUF397 domain-containing protein [Streptomyces tropicalis]MDF3301631.1 DUF397 domain-containing protein [Streptomyces tropicalis]